MMLMAPWFVLLVAALAAVVWVLQSHAGAGDRDDDALRVLDRRLAEGDLTAEEHGRRRRVLQEHASHPGAWSGTWRGAVAVIAVATITLLALGWLGMASRSGSGWMGGHMGSRGPTTSTAQVVEGAREVEVEAGELWFDPVTIEVTAAEQVNLRLVNTGRAFHDLTVPAAGVVLAAEPGEQAAGAIELSEPGRYEYYCSVPGHAAGGMRGTIIVSGTP